MTALMKLSPTTLFDPRPKVTLFLARRFILSKVPSFRQIAVHSTPFWERSRGRTPH